MSRFQILGNGRSPYKGAVPGLTPTFTTRSLVGGNGTAYVQEYWGGLLVSGSKNATASYAHADELGNPGYLTQANHSAGDGEKDLSKAQVYINGEHSDRNVRVKWTGSAIEPRVSVHFSNGEPLGIELIQGIDYDVMYFNNTKIGNAIVVITGFGKYTGSKTVHFQIIGRSGSKFFPEDTYSFKNPSELLEKKYYTRFFPATFAEDEYKSQGGSSHGICYGMVATAIASSALDSPEVSSYEGKETLFLVNKNDKSSVTRMTALDYIKYGYAIQFAPSISYEKQLSYERTREDIKYFYDKVVDSIHGTGEPICISIRGTDRNGQSSGHALWATGIGDETGSYTQIYVYDCNHPGETRSLYLNKNPEGQFVSWSYQLFDDPSLIWGSNRNDRNSNLGWSTPGDFFTTAFSVTGYVNSDAYNKQLSIRSSFDYQSSVSQSSIKIGEISAEALSNQYDMLLPIYIDAIGTNGFANSAQVNQYWLNTDEPVTVVSESDDTEISMTDSDSAITIRTKSSSECIISVGVDGEDRLTIKQDESAAFSTRFASIESDGELHDIEIAGIGSTEVTIATAGKDLYATGVTELTVHSGDESATRVVGLDEGQKYSIVIGDKDNSPHIILDGEAVPVFNQGVVAAAAGSGHSAAILEDGSLWTWGWNSSGQLGDGTCVDKLTSVKVMDDIVAVSLGAEHSAAIKNDGSLWTWGRNKYGSLGDGTTTSRTTPVKVMDNVKQVSCGNGTTAALKTDGTLWVWGFAGLDGLGTGEPGSLYDYQSNPVQLASDVAFVSMGNNLGAYVTTGGDLYTWGAGALDGSVGTGSKENVFVPTKILSGVSTVDMGTTSAAVKNDGSLWIWGSWNTDTPEKFLDSVESVEVGNGFVAALMRDGSLQTLGSNRYGQLGDSTEAGFRMTFSRACDGMAAVSVGDEHCIGVGADGALYSWGRNNRGQLGTGGTDDISSVTATVTGASTPLTKADTIDISAAEVTGVYDVPYAGGYATQPVVVTLSGNTLEEGWDYTAEYEGNGAVGDASVIIKGRGKYTGTVKAGFKVTGADISSATVSDIEEQTYSGVGLRPSVRVLMDYQTLTEGEDYTLEYSDNVNVGTAKVRIVGMGNYAGEKLATFSIAKAPQTITATDKSVAMGNSISLGAEASGDGRLTYATSDPKIATVSMSGDVTPVAAGAAEITITAPETDNYQSATKTITITVTDGTSNSRFIDVVKQTPHAEDILWLANAGISTGWTEADGTRTFRGAEPVRRQDMAAFLYRMAGSPAYVPSPADVAKFADVDASTPHHNEIWWMASTGISAGWRETDGTFTFRGMETIKRQDMAAFLRRLTKRLGGDYELKAGTENPFSDVDVASTPHADDILWLASAGVTTGWGEADGTRTYRGMGDVLRQDMAAFLHRLDGYISKTKN